MRAEILAVASERFVRNGYRATSMQELADHFGFTKPALYYYVHSKEQILVDLVRAEFDRLNAALQDVLDSTADPEERLRLLIRHHLEIVTRDARPLMVLEPNDFPEAPHYGTVVGELSAGYYQGWMRVIREGIDRGVFRADVDVEVATLGMIGMCAWAARWYRPDGRLAIAAVADEFAALVLEPLVTGR